MLYQSKGLPSLLFTFTFCNSDGEGVTSVTIIYFRADLVLMNIKKCVYIRVSQISPSYSSGQLQSYSVVKSIHVPPFRQGSDRHGPRTEKHHCNKKYKFCKYPSKGWASAYQWLIIYPLASRTIKNVRHLITKTFAEPFYPIQSSTQALVILIFK